MGLMYLFESEPDWVVCGEAASVEEALSELAHQQPDLVLVDLLLQGSSGMELIKQMAAQWEGVAVLVVSSYDEELYAMRALEAGAQGYVMKGADPEVLLEAAATVVAGRHYVSETVKDMLIGRMLGKEEARGRKAIATLTAREMEVFELMGRGLKRSAIADRLHLSPKTVDTYRERLKDKLGLTSSTQLVQQATVWVEEKV